MLQMGIEHIDNLTPLKIQKWLEDFLVNSKELKQSVKYDGISNISFTIKDGEIYAQRLSKGDDELKSDPKEWPNLHMFNQIIQAHTFMKKFFNENKNIFKVHGCFDVDEFNFECEILHNKYSNVIKYNNKHQLLVPLREFDGNMTLEEFTDFSDDLENSKEINIEVPVFSMDEETLDVKEYNDYEQWGFKQIETIDLNKIIEEGYGDKIKEMQDRINQILDESYDDLPFLTKGEVLEFKLNKTQDNYYYKMFEEVVYYLNKDKSTQKYNEYKNLLSNFNLTPEDFMIEDFEIEDNLFETSKKFFENTKEGKKLLKQINSEFKGKIKKYKKELQDELYNPENGLIIKIKDELLHGLNKKIEEKLNSEIEGIVIRNQEDDQIKLVDKEGFTKRLKKYWKYVDIVSNKTVEGTNGKKVNGIERTFMNELKLLTVNYIDYKYNDLKREFKEKSLEEFESQIDKLLDEDIMNFIGDLKDITNKQMENTRVIYEKFKIDTKKSENHSQVSLTGDSILLKMKMYKDLLSVLDLTSKSETERIQDYLYLFMYK